VNLKKFFSSKKADYSRKLWRVYSVNYNDNGFVSQKIEIVLKFALA
jgi:hypothetical protein